MIEGSTPTTAKAFTAAIGVSPSALARLADITSTAAAPSEMAEEFPAVTVPPLGLKAGASRPSSSRLASGRTTSS